MFRIFKQSIAAILAVIMCLSTLGLGAFAKTVTEQGTTWYGDELKVDITAGTDGYTYLSLFSKPAHGYEFSGHFLGDGEGPQTFVLIDTVANDNTTWSPNGVYESGKDNNYEVVYCCDVETIIGDRVYYKRLNLEDSEYYSPVEAAKIRAIVTNSYPYVSMEEMKADLAANGYKFAADLTLTEIIAAVQAAIWCCANDMTADELRYAKSYNVSYNYQWGQPLHDISNLSGLDVTGKRVFKTYPEVGERIDSLVDYLLAKEDVYVDTKSAVVTNLEIIDTIPVQAKDGVYTVVLKAELNSSGRDGDDLNIDITVDGENATTTKVIPGQNSYTFTVEAKAGQTIKAVMSGEQYLNTGVYFYAPRPADVDGDGIATSREVSQNLVGVAGGWTSVHSEAETLIPKFDIDPITADIELIKVDENGNALAGAKFDLFAIGENAELFANTYEVNKEGKLIIEDLLPGTYKIVESTAPNGYYRLKDAIEFSISEDGEVEAIHLPEHVTENADDDIFSLTVKNIEIAARVQFSGTKFFNGLRAEGFLFALKDENGNIITAESDANGNIVFPELRFYAEGEYRFEVYEIAGNDKTVVYDSRVYEIVVTVAGLGEDIAATVSINKNGSLYNGGADDLDFRNHSLIATEAVISGIKYLDGKPTAGYEFALMNGNTVVDTAFSGEDGRFSFELYYDEAGIYNYTVVEIAGNDKSIVYDNTVFDVSVEVTLDDYTLKADVECAEEIVFENMTLPEIIIFGEKYLDGVPAAGFEFALLDGDEIIATAVSGKDGVFEIHLTAPAAGTLNYTVVEIAGDDEMIIYDDTAYDITIEVIVEDGTLKSTTPDVEIVFNNRSVKPVDVVMSGSNYLDLVLTPGFSFTLTEGDKVIANVVSDENGHFTLPALSYNRPGTYVYKFVENAGDVDTIIYDESVYTITVVVTLEGDSLVADVNIHYLDKSNPFKQVRSAKSNTVVIENLDFYNWTIRTNAVIDGTKYLDGKAAAGFEFALMDGQNIIAIAESDANGKFSFRLDCNATGVFNYTVVEIAGNDENIIYDDSVINVKITVVREGIELVATVETDRAVEFNNETIPPETTEPETETTEPTPETSEPTPETTEPTPETTEPETEEITDETTPLDPTPDTTEPVETEEVPEESVPLTDVPTTTEPEESGKTGDNGIFVLAIAFIAIISLAVAATKKKNVED